MPDEHALLARLLPQVRLAVPAPRPGTQSVTMTPPAVARLLGIYSLAVYQAYAVWSENLFAYGELSAAVASTHAPSGALPYCGMQTKVRMPATASPLSHSNGASSNRDLRETEGGLAAT